MIIDKFLWTARALAYKPLLKNIGFPSGKGEKGDSQEDLSACFPGAPDRCKPGI